MSDLIKNKEIFAQLEQTKDFRFVSEFSKWLRETRLKHNVTLLDFANALGVNTPKVSAWENDRELLTNIQAMKIAKFFKEKGEIINYVELMKMQRKAIFINLIEARKIFNEIIDSIKGK